MRHISEYVCALHLDRYKFKVRGLRATSCTQQSQQQQQQQQQQRTEGVHTEREAGHIMPCMYTFSDRINLRSNHKTPPYVESDDFKIISHFQRRRTGVVLESLYHVVADVESPSEKSCAN